MLVGSRLAQSVEEGVEREGERERAREGERDERERGDSGDTGMGKGSISGMGNTICSHGTAFTRYGTHLPYHIPYTARE